MPSSYILKVNEDSLTIRKNGVSLNKALNISFDHQISEQTSNPPADIFEPNKIDKFEAILGVKVIKTLPFLVIVRQKQQIQTFQGSQIYEIKSIDWIPILNLKDQERAKQIQKNKEIMSQLSQISQLFEEGMHYYSDHYQLNKPYLLNSLKCTEDEEKYYEQFVWNRNIMKIDIVDALNHEELVHKGGANINMSSRSGQSDKSVHSQRQKNIQNGRSIDEQSQHSFLSTKQNYIAQSQIFRKWCTPIIQGYVSSFEERLPNSVKIPYLLISRRSNKKAGTRFFSRGIDDNGNVANYTESQQIIQMHNKVMTNLEIRGSVPVFFEQVGMEGINIELNVTRSKELTRKTFRQHFETLKKYYNRVLCVNLLTEHKKSEKKLTDFFEEMLNDLTKEQSSPFVKYKFFDFHEQCKNNQFQNSSKLIDEFKGFIKDFGYNVFDRSTRAVAKKQTGIFRTNCLDCLDRTNYIQSRIALCTLMNMIEENSSADINKAIESEKIFAQIEISKNSVFLNHFNRLWAENGDAVSLHYTGIGSTHTDITKTGKRTMFGTVNHKMRSLMRFYTQFTDVKKHETINNFLGHKSQVEITSDASYYFDKNLNENRYEKVFTLSWEFTSPDVSLDIFENSLRKNRTFQYLLSQIKQTNKNSQVEEENTLIVVYCYVPNKLTNWTTNLETEFKKKLNPFSAAYRKGANDSASQIVKSWGSVISSEMQGNQYCLLDSNSNCFNSLMVFCKADKIDKVSNIKHDQVSSIMKTNQCVLLTKFLYNGSSLVFQAINVKNLQSFKSYTESAYEQGFQYKDLGKSKSTKISSQSYRLLMGNIGSKTLQNLSQKQIIAYQNQINFILEDYWNPSTKNQKGIQQHQQSRGKNLQRLNDLITKGQQNDEFKVNQERLNKQSRTIMNYDEPPLQFMAGNNRILFSNECGKIIKANCYRKVIEEKREKDGEVYPQHSVSCQLRYEIGDVYGNDNIKGNGVNEVETGHQGRVEQQKSGQSQGFLKRSHNNINCSSCHRH